MEYWVDHEHKKVFVKYDKILFPIQFEDQVIYKYSTGALLSFLYLISHMTTPTKEDISHINELTTRAELEIIQKIEQCYPSVLDDCIQQLKTYWDLSVEIFPYEINPSNKYSIPSNQLLVRLINELSLYFWRLMEINLDLSYYLQSDELTTIETSLLSSIISLNEYNQQRCDLLSQSSSDIITNFDKEMCNKLHTMALETINISESLKRLIVLPNDTTGIIGDR
jgi:hypothetical protein